MARRRHIALLDFGQELAGAGVVVVGIVGLVATLIGITLLALMCRKSFWLGLVLLLVAGRVLGWW